VEAFNKVLKNEEEQKVLLYTSKNRISRPSNLQPKLLAHEIKRCSVIIVSYRTGDILLDCLKSVLQQEARKTSDFSRQWQYPFVDATSKYSRR
jgi:hypothetical protein